VTAIEYMCTKFGVDSSGRFPFSARTNRRDRMPDPLRRGNTYVPNDLYIKIGLSRFVRTGVAYIQRRTVS